MRLERPVCTSFGTMTEQWHYARPELNFDFEDEDMQLTSFSDIGELDQPHDCVSDLENIEAEEDFPAKRQLYTIEEETEKSSPRTCLIRSEQWDNLEACGRDLEIEEESEYYSKSSLKTSYNLETRECSSRKHGTAESDKLSDSELSAVEELRMFPNITDDEKKVGTIYSSFYLRQRISHESVQCEILRNVEDSCQKCSVLKDEVTRITKLLKKAEAEIDYLNDEFRIMNEEKRQECEYDKQNFDSTEISRFQSHTIEPQSIFCFAKWVLLGLWGLPRIVMQRIFRP